MKNILLVIALSVFSISVFAKGNPLYEDGYRGNVSVESGFSFDYEFAGSILTSHGYSTGFGLYTGIGVGLNFMPDAVTYLAVPCFIEMKYSFWNSRFSPYVDIKTGCNISVENGSSGLYVSPSVGIDIAERYSIFIKYDYMTTKDDNEMICNKNSISVGFNIGF